MRVLIAEDDRPSRRLLEATLTQWGYEVLSTADGTEAWQVLQQDDRPSLVVLDLEMPGLDGIEVCRKVREISDSQLPYIIILSAWEGKKDITDGLRAGADDYVTKPFDSDELRARIQVGARVVELQEALTGRLRELEDAISRIKQLHGLLPICASCKKIRDDQGYWNQIEGYISSHSDAEFSHSICPDCTKTLYPEIYEKINSSDNASGPKPEAGSVDNLQPYDTYNQADERLPVFEQQSSLSQNMEVVGQLTSGVAHDFNNMLTAIISYTQLTMNRIPDDEHLRRYLHEIQKAADRAADLTRQLLTFRSQESNDQQVLSLNDLILDNKKMLRRLISEDIELVVLLAPNLGMVEADPSQIGRILINLVLNARDAMADGGKLTIETTNTTLGQDYT
ncbi:response regulator, partial [Patescibacteria group bacterium]|nr:response regulator [Patescibacteria group bacterium]